jgi:hypothetical protein
MKLINLICFLFIFILCAYRLYTIHHFGFCSNATLLDCCTLKWLSNFVVTHGKYNISLRNYHAPWYIWLWKGDGPLNVFIVPYVDDECHLFSAESLPRVCNDVNKVHTVIVRDRSVVKSPTLRLFISGGKLNLWSQNL